MDRPGLAPALLMLAAVLGACSDRGKPPAPAAAALPASAASAVPAAVAHGVTVHARIHPDGPDMVFTLFADEDPAPGGAESVLHVRAIEVRRAGAGAAVQRIDGLATDTPWSAAAPGLELLDMDFDGHADMRLIASRPAGPNTPYLNWLYQPASGRFVASPLLNDLAAPRFDAVKREIRSDWRDGPTRHGSDVYVVRDGQPVLERKETRDYTRPGVYTLRVSRQVKGAWKVVEQRTLRDP